MAQRLKTLYLTSVAPTLRQQLQYSNLHQVPRLQKLVINCGIGEASQNAKSLESALRDLSVITGQKPVVTRARKAIAGFQIREKMPVGIRTTLRGEAMYAFLDRLVNLALPRIRDFQGLSWKSFDGHGNFHLGLREQLVFPEINYEKIDKLRGVTVGNDTIASMITCIRNGILSKMLVVKVPATRTTRSIGTILVQEGFLENLRERQVGTTRFLLLTLRYQGKQRLSCITTLRRISKPGVRVYSKHQDIPKVLGGMGIVILSTSQGIMVDREARQKQVGGELLCYVW
eukprot:jgi/Mesen1/286/ME1155895C09513